jgi:hypothetical protein
VVHHRCGHSANQRFSKHCGGTLLVVHHRCGHSANRRFSKPQFCSETSGNTHLYGQVDFVRIIGDFLSPREMELLSFGTQHPSLHRTAGNWLTRCGPLKAILADELHEGWRLIRLRRSRLLHASGRLCGPGCLGRACGRRSSLGGSISLWLFWRWRRGPCMCCLRTGGPALCLARHAQAQAQGRVQRQGDFRIF